MIIEKLIDKEGLSDTEKQIANYILKRESDITSITSVELGKRSYTSQSAVIRFYKKLGLNTYREFLSTVLIERNEYFKNLDIISNLMNEQLLTYEGVQKIVSGLYMQTMMSTNRVIDKNMMTRFCNRILSSKMVDIYAIGESEILAHYLSYKFQSMGIYCSCHNTYKPSYINHIQNKSTRVSLVISDCDENDTLVYIAKKLKENNCYVASLCSIKNKKLMLYSHDYIHFDVGNYEHYHDISTLFAVEYISDILYLNMLTRSTKK